MPQTSFNERAASKDGLQPWCRTCNQKKSREYYSKNKEKQIQQIYASRKRRKSIIVRKLHAYLKENPCTNCGFDKVAALDFDHLDEQEKEMNISLMIADGYSWENILKEIKKCQVLCSNCHRIKTARDYKWYMSDIAVTEEDDIVPRRKRSPL